jgi:hypothetical protein
MVMRPNEGGQSRKMKSYEPSRTGSSARLSRPSRENWLTSSISAPARSIVDVIASRPLIGEWTIASVTGDSATITS